MIVAGDGRDRKTKMGIVLNDAMKALTARKPIALTTTSLCSGAFAARIARSQRLHVLRIAGVASAGWESIDAGVTAGLFKTSGLDLQATLVPDAAAAARVLAVDGADVGYIDALGAIRACAYDADLRFIATSADTSYAYVARASAIEAHRYAMTRFTRALRANGDAVYVDAAGLQTLVDTFAAETSSENAFDVRDRISSIAVLSGTR